MSVTGSPRNKDYAPSDITDAIVVAVLAVVCFGGILLTAPTPDQPAQSILLADGSVNPVYIPTLTLPDNLPDAVDPARDADLTSISPTPPAITPPPDIEPPLVDPEPPTPQLPAITLRTLPELAPSQLIASAPGFISLMGTSYDATNWHRSTHNASGDFQATNWTTDHAVYDADGLSLRIEHAPGRPNEFLGGEIQTRETYGYGRYEVLMRPAKASGTVSSFFTYTGPYYGNPHDEVDIEFLGEDTTKVYLNYFRNGKVGEHQTIDLPFDASDDFHLYAFEWRPDAITWFVDGQPIHQTRPNDRGIPQTPSSLIVNLWSGQPKLRSWHGAPNFTSTVEADYGCISFQPIGGTGRSCAKIFPPDTPPEAPETAEPNPNIFERTVGSLLKQFLPRQGKFAQVN